MGRKSKPRSPNTSPKPLPPMQERFVHEYLIDLNAALAAAELKAVLGPKGKREGGV